MTETGSFHRTRVRGLQRMAPGAFLFSLERASDFIPGQCLSLSLDPATGPRSCSIASGRGSDWEVLFDVVSGGLLTPRLSAVKAGDSISVSAPFGNFADEDGPSIWIATGTGIAPFASMARSGMAEGKTLIHGSRLLSGLFFRGLFASMFGARYIPCSSAEDDGEVFHGRLTSYLRKCPLDAGSRYLLCGSAEMVVDVRDLLIDRGVPFANIGAEIYF